MPIFMVSGPGEFELIEEPNGRGMREKGKMLLRFLRPLAEPPKQIIAIFGPRQTGKTTIVRQALSRIDLESRYLAVDEPETDEFRFGPHRIPSDTVETTFRLPQARRDTEWLVHNWEAARRAAERFGRGFVLVFDEIQKIDRWSETVKGLWDADRASGCPLHVVILGSAPLLMQSGLNESLAGRLEPLHVTHWSFDKMATAFDCDLPSYLYFGGYPGADRTFWGHIVESAVGAHLYNTAPSDIRVFYWRDRKSREVDFVLQRGSQVVTVEVKIGPRKRRLRGKEAFEQGFRSRLRGSVLVGDGGLPLNEFLTMPARQWFEEV